MTDIKRLKLYNLIDINNNYLNIITRIREKLIKNLS